jgi:hypothetical protein
VCLDREVILFVDSEFSGGRHILQFETCLSGSLTSSHTSVIKKSHIQSSSRQEGSGKLSKFGGPRGVPADQEESLSFIWKLGPYLACLCPSSPVCVL